MAPSIASFAAHASAPSANWIRAMPLLFFVVLHNAAQIHFNSLPSPPSHDLQTPPQVPFQDGVQQALTQSGPWHDTPVEDEVDL